MNPLSLKSFRVWGICVFQFLMRAAINILFVTSQSAFFIVAGVDKLPYVYTAMNILYISLQYFSINNLKGSSGDYIKKIALIFLGILLVRFLFIPHASTAVTIFYLLLVMIFDLFFGQFFSHFLNEIFPLQEGKKLLPMITGFGSLSFIISGFIIKLCLNVMSVNNLVGIGIGIFTSGLVLLAIYTSIHGKNEKEEKEEVNAKTEKQTSENKIPIFSFSTLGRLIIVMTFMNMLGKYWMDFQYSKAITSAYTSPEALAGFIAIYSSIVDALVLLSQLTFAGVLLRKFGLVNITRLLPIIVLPLTVFAMIRPTFWTIIGAQFCYTYLIKSFYYSSSTLFMSTFPSAQRMRLMSVNGIFASAGAMISGVSLIAFQSYLSTTHAFFLLAMVFAVMLWLCIFLKKAYAKELESCIDRADTRANPELIKAIMSLKDSAIKAAYLDELFHDDDEKIRLQALIQAGVPQSKLEAEKMLQLVFHDISFKVRSLAIKQLAQSPHFDPKECIKQIFAQGDPDPRFLANLIESLANNENCGVSESFFADLLNNTHHRVRSAAALALIHISDSSSAIQRALICLRGMLHSFDNPEFQTAGIVALTTLDNPVFIADIARLIWSKNESVATAAIKSMAEFPAPEVIGLLDSFAAQTNSAALRKFAISEQQRLNSLIKNDFHLLLGNLTSEERMQISKKLRSLKEDDVEIFQRVMRLEDSSFRMVLWETLSHHKTPVLSTLLSSWLSEQNETIIFCADNLPSALPNRIISDSGFQALMTRLLEKELLETFDLLLSIQQRLLVYRMLILAKNSPDKKEKVDEQENKKQLVSDLTILLNFLAARSSNPAKVLEAIEWIQSEDPFVKSTGLEYLESVLPMQLQNEFLPVLLHKGQSEILIQEIEKNAQSRPLLAQEKRRMENENAD